MNDVKEVFKYSKFLMFADDSKSYIHIYSHKVCIKLQIDLDYFHLWCSSNGLNVNAEKFSQIYFSRRNSKINFHYRIISSEL